MHNLLLEIIPCATILSCCLIFVKYKTHTKCNHDWETISKSRNCFGEEKLLLKCKKCGKIEKHKLG